MAISQSQHILDLSKELLDDIELERLSSDKLLLKCVRLARLAGSEECQEWLRYEMGGYGGSSEISLKYMTLTGRWTNREEKKGYWGPLAEQEAAIQASQAKIASLQIPSLSGDKAWIVSRDIMASMNAAAGTLSKLGGIRSRVLALLHRFVSDVYYEREFSSLAELTFERYKRDVDTLISAACKEVLRKIPSVIDRLQEGDPEAISQALTTCRRIIESFADAIFPPTEDVIEVGGNTLKLDNAKHLNRINAYVSEHTESHSRRQKLRQNLANLYDRACAGVHDGVTKDEAFSLFLNTYLFLGEILTIGSPHASSAGEEIDDAS